MKTIWTDDDAMRWQDTKSMVATNEPFFAYIAYQMHEVFTQDVPTLATDGKNIYVNQEFVKGHIRFEQAIFRLHEVGHVALKHPLKIAPGGEWEHLDRPTILQAMDYVLNLFLRDSTKAWLQPQIWSDLVKKTGMLLDDRFSGMTTIQVYDILLKESQKKGGGKGSGGAGSKPTPSCCKPVKGEDGGTPSEAEMQEIERKIDGAIVQAGKIAKAMGKMPAGADRLVEEIIQPEEDYLSRLKRYMTGYLPRDYTWARPHRSYIHRGLYLPSIEKSGVGRIGFGVDTSGSMMKEELALCWGVVSEMCETHQPEKLWLVFCDSAAYPEEVEPYASLDFKSKGGGGTDFEPVFEWAKKEQPDVLIYFTDLECDASRLEKPDFPVIWLHTRPLDNVQEQYRPKFGDFIEVKPKKK